MSFCVSNLNIFPQEEIGDAYMLMSYSSDNEELIVDLNRLLFPSDRFLKNITSKYLTLVYVLGISFC